MSSRRPTRPGVPWREITWALLLPALLSVAPRDVVHAQETTGPRVLVPGFEEYGAGGLKRFLLGTGHRELWVQPLRVPVLDLASFGGGLEPLRAGGGNQTRTLHMTSPDGRRWVFRSVNKFPEQGMPEDVRGTFLGSLIEDQMSAYHPTGAQVVPPLLAAADVLHVTPLLVVMPDDPALGEYRSEYAGMLGQIELRPDEDHEGPVFAGAERIVGTDRMRERMRESAEDRVDGRAFLAARLVDFIIGDTDRGSDQWRWAETGVAPNGSMWTPIPRDRDFAFMRSNGLLPRVARMAIPKLVEFGPRYPSLGSLVFSSIHLDREFLASVDRAAWDSTTAAVHDALTDGVLAAAVALMPPEHRALSAADLLAGLRARRDALPGLSRGFYDHLAREVDVNGTDEQDRAEIDILADGSVRVRLSRRSAYVASISDGALPSAPYFERVFSPGETREVRIYLHDGDDAAVVRGGATDIAVRVIGGAGDDLLADSTADGEQRRLSFHDAEGDDTLRAGAGTRIDRRPFAAPDTTEDWLERKISRKRYRDWGVSRSIAPVIDYREGAGLIIGARASRTRYGFRRVPHAARLHVDALFALDRRAFGVELGMSRPSENSPWTLLLDAHASRFDAFRFYGLGNATSAPDHDLALVTQDRVWVRPGLGLELSPKTRLSFGVRADWRGPDAAADSPLRTSGMPGAGSFASAGAWAQAVIDATRGEAYPEHGIQLLAGTSAVPAVLDATAAFGDVHAEARSYFSFGPTLALRAGAQKVWGTFPAQHAAFIGGRTTLRGFRHQRFAGDAALYGSVELRVPLTRLELLTRGDLGLIGFADGGRVFVDGESPGGWHTGFGGGLSFTSLGVTVNGTYAQGEEGRAYLSVGMPF